VRKLKATGVNLWHLHETVTCTAVCCHIMSMKLELKSGWQNSAGNCQQTGERQI